MMFGGPFDGPLPDHPVLVVPQSLIDRYGVDELKRLFFEEYHRDVEIVSSKPMPVELIPAVPSLRIPSQFVETDPWRGSGKRRAARRK